MKTAILMSGGIDSSIASYLLLKEGFDLVGVFLNMYPNSLCCSEEALIKAKEFARRFNFPFINLNVEDAFREFVINRFISSYENGITPNPCIICNKNIKFGLFLDYALKELNVDFIASGHYARVNNINDRFLLLKGLDPLKDQSYVLYSLNQNVLSRLLLPLGNYKKENIRGIAKEIAVDLNFGRESEDLCFVDGDYKTFLKNYIPSKLGKIVSLEGEVLGEHNGIHLFTLGQREGLGISSKEPLYVVELDSVNNIVKVGHREQLFKRSLMVENINFIPFDFIKDDIRATAKVRYRGEEKPCVIRKDAENFVITFDEPQFAITSGQSIVFYLDDVVLGGGEIKKVL